MPLTFDDDECYRLMLACDAFIEEYSPATAGEAAHLEKTIAVRLRLRDLYDEKRIAFGHRPLYRAVVQSRDTER